MILAWASPFKIIMYYVTKKNIYEKNAPSGLCDIVCFFSDNKWR